MCIPRAFECYYFEVILNWWHSSFKTEGSSWMGMCVFFFSYVAAAWVKVPLVLFHKFLDIKFSFTYVQNSDRTKTLIKYLLESKTYKRIHIMAKNSNRVKKSTFSNDRNFIRYINLNDINLQPDIKYYT
jgi:hypothetical protein